MVLLYPLSLNSLIVLREKSNILSDIVCSSFLRFTLIILPISNCPTRINLFFLSTKLPLEIMLVQHRSQCISMLPMSLQDCTPPYDSYDHGHYQSQDSYDYERIRTFSACHISETSTLHLKF